VRLYFVLALALVTFYSMTVCAQALNEIRSGPMICGPVRTEGKLVWTPPPAEPAIVRVVLGL
jgi:hypothetical protein